MRQNTFLGAQENRVKFLVVWVEVERRKFQRRLQFPGRELWCWGLTGIAGLCSAGTWLSMLPPQGEWALKKAELGPRLVNSLIIILVEASYLDGIC